MSYFIDQKDAEESILPTLPIPLHSREKDKEYRVTTLLDSGSSTNWITKALLKRLHHTVVGSTELEVYTLTNIERRNFKLVEVYHKE